MHLQFKEYLEKIGSKDSGESKLLLT